MKNTIAIRREDLSKKGERRVAVDPELAAAITGAGHRLMVQPRNHPETGEEKRAFADEAYAAIGAEIAEDISHARVVFGLKEIEVSKLMPGKAYYFFSHTHKGQKKNRKMLQVLVDQGCSLFDYELITEDNGARVITAFTYFAGYAGMIDSLWTYGERVEMAGHDHPFSRVPQSMEKEDLKLIKTMLSEIGEEIKHHGTPEELPPMITCVLGTGKTSFGAQVIYDILPVEEIKLEDVERVYHEGGRDRVYKLVLEIDEMFRLKEGAGPGRDAWPGMSHEDRRQLYFDHPEYFESNLDGVLPYVSILMNCILWGPEYPRTLSNRLMASLWESGTALQVIGDVTCDPNGSIEFSKETWIDDPVYIYDPKTGQMNDGFEGEGVAVMAVTNLPCEFSADASSDFSDNLKPLLEGIISADYDGDFENASLPPAAQRACILWKGEFRPEYAYMKEYLG